MSRLPHVSKATAMDLEIAGLKSRGDGAKATTRKLTTFTLSNHNSWCSFCDSQAVDDGRGPYPPIPADSRIGLMARMCTTLIRPWLPRNERSHLGTRA